MTSEAKTTSDHRPPRLLYICDWLPPDFGAVGQYSELFARQLAQEGHDVVLGGLSSTGPSRSVERFPNGTLTTIRIHARTYAKHRFLERLSWTVATNTRLVASLGRSMRWADEILFTGSPPLMLHWMAPLNFLLRKRLIYRITDFHPECLIAARSKPSFWLTLLYKLTIFWRRRIHMFEILGADQRARLQEIGIPAERIRLKRDPSPVAITPQAQPLPRPAADAGKLLLLYSGNWGVAHDHRTFLAAYRLHHTQGSGRFVLWLNAVGAAVKMIENELEEHSLPYIRGTPVPLEELAGLLVTPDAHLITLSDEFVGFVLPSKVYGCAESGRPVLFIGSARSDVHRICTERMHTLYKRVEVGDVDGCWQAMERMAEAVVSQTADAENSTVLGQ